MESLGSRRIVRRPWFGARCDDRVRTLLPPFKGSLERLLGPFDDRRAGRLNDPEQDTHGVIRAALRIRSPEGAAFSTLRTWNAAAG